MRQNVKIILILVIVFGLSPVRFAARTAETEQSSAKRKRLLFLDFYNKIDKKDYEWLENSIGDSMHELIKNKYDYDRIEREVWLKYYKDRRMKAADLFNKEIIARMGRTLGADGVIFGQFDVNEQNGELFIEGKIMNVPVVEIIATKSGSSDLSPKMFDTVENVSTVLADKIRDLFFPSDLGAVWRAAVLPGWGHYYKGQKTWGYLWSGAFATSAAFSLVSGLRFASLVDDYNNLKPAHEVSPDGGIGFYNPARAAKQFDDLEKQTNQWLEITKVSLYVTAGIWLLNIAHAWFIAPAAQIDYGAQDTGKAGYSFHLERLDRREHLFYAYHYSRF